MGTFVVSGSASGMGAATAALLCEGGTGVIGLDVRDAGSFLVCDGGTQALLRPDDWPVRWEIGA